METMEKMWSFAYFLVLPVTSTLGGPYSPLLSVHCCLADFIPHHTTVPITVNYSITGLEFCMGAILE